MSAAFIVRMIDTVYREKRVAKAEIVAAMESAIERAARKRFGDRATVAASVDLATGVVACVVNGNPVSAEEVLSSTGFCEAVTVIASDIGGAQRKILLDKYERLRGELVTGRYIEGTQRPGARVHLGDCKAVIPRENMIPGEVFQRKQKITAIVERVSTVGRSAEIVLSRVSPLFVVRLFERREGRLPFAVWKCVREPGYRTKLLVSAPAAGPCPRDGDDHMAAVEACYGEDGSALAAVLDELAGERVDVLPWSSDDAALIRSAIEPAEVADVKLYPLPHKAVAIVPDDQLDLAAGRDGKNVLLASKLTGWDIEAMTAQQFSELTLSGGQYLYALTASRVVDVDALLAAGIFSIEELTYYDAADIAAVAGVPVETAAGWIAKAEEVVDG